MEHKYELKEVETGSLKFQIGVCDDEATTSFYSSQIHDFELLSKNLTPSEEHQPSSVEYFEPGVIKAKLIVEEKSAIEKNGLDEEDSTKLFKNWTQLACKLEKDLEEDFLKENIEVEISEKDIKEDTIEENLKSEETADWSSQLKNFEGIAKHFEKKQAKTKNNGKMSKIVPNNRTCKYCGVEFPNYRLCFLHQKTVHEGIWHKCDICDYVNSRKDIIRIHREKEHENVRYPCDKCDYKGKTRAHLKGHNERIHQKLSFDWYLCKFSCKSKSTLNYHVQLIHQGIGQQCPKCEYKTYTLGKLKSHVKAVHDKIKEFQCDQCDYRAMTARQLKLHLQVHEGAEFKCDYCDKVCAQRGSILRHMKVKHKSQHASTQS